MRYAILSYKVHDSICHVLAAVLSIQLLYFYHQGLQTVPLANELNRKPDYTKTVRRRPVVGHNMNRGDGTLQRSLDNFFLLLVAPL